MKKSLHLLLSALLVAGAFQLTSCESNEKKAEESMTAFLDALVAHDFEKAKELSTPETQEILVVVEKESEKYKEANTDTVEITYEIIEQEVVDSTASFTVKIIIGETEKVEIIKLTIVEEQWLVVMPATQIVIVQFVVFYGRYDIIIKSYTRKTYKKYIKGTKKRNKKSKKSSKKTD